MDLQTRKINVIEYIVQLQDEDELKKIEETIFKGNDIGKKTFKPFTEKQLVERARKSDEDYLSGKYMPQEQLEIESQQW